MPVDLFAPPDAAAEQKFELAADEIEHREARKKAATPPAPMPVVTDKPSSPVLRPKGPSLQPGNVPTGGVVATSPWDMPRWRFAGGVLAAVLVGFIPAHCVASIREDAYDTIDQDVATKESLASRADAPVPASQIDAFRETRLADKKSKRRNIALVSMLIWAIGGAGVGYLWFRRVPWDRIKFGQNWP